MSAQGPRTRSRPWWEPGVIYQVYPRSFQDTNGDGIGDLPGIAERLDYLAWLGIDAIWLSPIFPSPMADFGYDVVRLLRHRPDVRHARRPRPRSSRGARARTCRSSSTSCPITPPIEHPWFVESRILARRTRSATGTSGATRRPTAGRRTTGSRMFGGSAWTLDEPTGQYYLHAFLAEQPDLNWRNPAVRDAMLRRDAVLARPRRRRLPHRRHLACSSKDEQLRDNPPNPDCSAGQPHRSQPAAGLHGGPARGAGDRGRDACACSTSTAIAC